MCFRSHSGLSSEHRACYALATRFRPPIASPLAARARILQRHCHARTFNADPLIGAVVSFARRAHQRLNELNQHSHWLKMAIAAASRLAQAADAVRHITEFWFAGLLDELASPKSERAGWDAAHGDDPLRTYDPWGAARSGPSAGRGFCIYHGIGTSDVEVHDAAAQTQIYERERSGMACGRNRHGAR